MTPAEIIIYSLCFAVLWLENFRTVKEFLQMAITPFATLCMSGAAKPLITNTRRYTNTLKKISNAKFGNRIFAQFLMGLHVVMPCFHAIFNFSLVF